MSISICVCTCEYICEYLCVLTSVLTLVSICFVHEQRIICFHVYVYKYARMSRTFITYGFNVRVLMLSLWHPLSGAVNSSYYLDIL